MSVYTEIPENHIAMFCSQFGIVMSSATPIQNGVENSNWFISADDGSQYVMTLFEERGFDEVTTLSRIMLALAETNLPVAVPRRHESGLLHAKYRGKALQVAPRLAGSHPDTANLAMCRHMGESLARLHGSLASLTPAEDYTLAQYPWLEVRNAQMAKMSQTDKKLMYKIWQSYQRAQVVLGETSEDDALPQGLTHGDLFLDNTLWQGDTLTGLLDFTEVCTDHLLMDIAITANDFCTQWELLSESESAESMENAESVESMVSADMLSTAFDHDKLAEIIAGYTSVRPLTDTEQKALPVFLAMAAARFWLLRLDIAEQNATKGRTGDHVLVKSPKLMRDLAGIHFAAL